MTARVNDAIHVQVQVVHPRVVFFNLALNQYCWVDFTTALFTFAIKSDFTGVPKFSAFMGMLFVLLIQVLEILLTYSVNNNLRIPNGYPFEKCWDSHFTVFYL